MSMIDSGLLERVAMRRSPDRLAESILELGQVLSKLQLPHVVALSRQDTHYVCALLQLRSGRVIRAINIADLMVRPPTRCGP